MYNNLVNTPSYDHRAPTLWVDRQAWYKIMKFAEIATGEISGFGYLTVVNPTQLVLVSAADVFITKQVVTAGTADVTNVDSAMALYQAMVDGRSDDLRFQWHSHVQGAAYCSTRDMENIDRVGANGGEWWVSLVVNKRQEWFARLDMFLPFRLSTELRVMQWDHNPDLDAECQAEVASKVTTKTMPVTPTPRRRRYASANGQTVALTTSTGTTN